MNYAYYPGCNLEGACQPYDRSLRRVMKVLGHELAELDDWTCCGATMNMSVREVTALAVSARNLALVEQTGSSTLLTPCSACYITLKKTQLYLDEESDLRRQVEEALAAAGLGVSRQIDVRHPLDVIVNDIGIQTVALRAERRLDGLRIAPYYGCQLIQPEGEDDQPDWSTSMDDLFAALGAESIHYPARTRCCGGMLMAAYPEVGPELTGDLFGCAIQNGADVIATACPLCQINLEDHQRRARDRVANGGPAAAELPVFFFTQLLGIALGEHFEDMDLHRSLVPPGTRLRELAGVL